MADLEWREGVYMNVRHRILDGRDDAKIGVAIVARMNAALQAHFSRPCLPRLARTLRNHFQLEPVGRPAQLSGAAPLGEGAESAVIQADVGVVDVAVDDVGDLLAHRGAAQATGAAYHRAESRPLNRKERDDRLRGQLLAARRPRQYRAELARHR